MSLVTFNYDRLLERAVESLTRSTINTIDDYLSIVRFALFKVHGSVDWGRVVTKLAHVATVGRILLTAALSLVLVLIFETVHMDGNRVNRVLAGDAEQPRDAEHRSPSHSTTILWSSIASRGYGASRHR